MSMELDKHSLEERYDWQRRNYEKAVRRVINVIVDAIQQETKRALERPIRYDDDIRGEYTFTDQAAEIQHSILQAVNNADFRGLTNTAGDVHATAQAMHVLEKFKASLPAEMRAALEERETSGLQGRIEERKQEVAELDDRDARTCRAAVPERGRGVGFHRCSKTGKVEFTVDKRPGHFGQIVAADDPNAVTVKVCASHAKDAERGRIHVWTPSPWEEEQRKLHRARTARELAAMESRLPKQLQAGPPVVQEDADEVVAYECDSCGLVFATEDAAGECDCPRCGASGDDLTHVIAKPTDQGGLVLWTYAGMDRDEYLESKGDTA